MANKLLLIEDVEALGRSGDIVGVKPGYARNFLIPQGLAVVASKQALRMQARLQEERTKRAESDRQESEGLSSKLEGQVVTTIVKVDHDGHMYGSVTLADVVDLLAAQQGVTLDKKSIQLKHPLKTLGNHTINVKLKEGVMASFILSIESETKAIATEKAERQEKAAKNESK